MASHVKKNKHNKALKSNRVEDSDDLESYDFSSDEGCKTAIHAMPLDSHPPPQPMKNRLSNCGLEDS
jgi:hypothetical protein